MLILTRKENEKIIIGDNITITVTEISKNGTQVKLGIDAPKEITVNREEIAIQKKNKSKKYHFIRFLRGDLK